MILSDLMPFQISQVIISKIYKKFQSKCADERSRAAADGNLFWKCFGYFRKNFLDLILMISFFIMNGKFPIFSPALIFSAFRWKFFFENVHYYKATPYLSTSSLFQGKEREKKFHFQLKSSNLDKAHKKVTSMVSEKEERLLV